MPTTTSAATTTAAAPAPDDIECGSYAPAHSGEHATGPFVIATYNIRYAVGRFLISGGLLRKAGLTLNRPRPAVVARHIAAAAAAFTAGRLLPPADIIALQEADRGTLRTGGHHVARELAAALRLHYARAAMRIPPGAEPHDRQWYLDFEERILSTDPGDTGVALLSRFPLAAVARVELPWTECAYRPRLALAATARVAGRNLHLFNSHIDPHADVPEQLAQHDAVLAQAARHAAEPAVLLGDFNTLFGAARTAARRHLEAHGFTTPLPTGTATWRAGLIRLHADWIFVRGLRVRRWGVARPLNVSDHWPVWAEVEFS